MLGLKLTKLVKGATGVATWWVVKYTASTYNKYIPQNIWNGNVIIVMKLSSLRAPVVFILDNSSATREGNLGKLNIHQWLL